jgi:hypothetical protein
MYLGLLESPIHTLQQVKINDANGVRLWQNLLCAMLDSKGQEKH